jgi:hypothetical protein
MFEQLIQQAKSRKLFVSNLYEGTDGSWRCFLRDKRNGRFTSQAVGATASDALSRALETELANAPKPFTAFDFSDLI